MPRPTTLLLLSSISFVTQVSAWGSLGHQTVGAIAQSYLTSSTATWARSLLSVSSSNTTYLATVGPWADSFRLTKAGSFSAPLHYIDANDDPPSSCSIDYTRDCGESGCVVSAINNYTTRVQDTSLDHEQRMQALMFLVHFFGDITQPLHDEGFEEGGNGVNVTFDGTHTNLHHVWDSNIAEKLVGGYELSDAETWAAQIKSDIDSGEYKSSKAGWVSGLKLDDPIASATWMAADANKLVCDDVVKKGIDAVEDTDLGGQYYDDNKDVVQMQIAKGGYRLAAWLNLIVTGKTGL